MDYTKQATGQVWPAGGVYRPPIWHNMYFTNSFWMIYFSQIPLPVECESSRSEILVYCVYYGIPGLRGAHRRCSISDF